MQHCACVHHSTELHSKPLNHSELSLNRPPTGPYTAQYMVVSAVNFLFLSSPTSSAPMLHSVWTDCRSDDEPLGGQFSSQVSARTPADTKIKFLVFAIYHWLSGESDCLLYTTHKEQAK